MGTPTYRSTSYDGKGSTNRRGTIVNSVEDGVMVSRETRGANRKSKSPMVEMLELLEEVERCREVVADRQSELARTAPSIVFASSPSSYSTTSGLISPPQDRKSVV